MKIHVIISKKPEITEQEIEKNFSGQYYKLTDNSWVLAADSTARDVSEKIGIGGDNHKSSGFVAPISGYFGRMPTDLWEWLRIYWEK